MTDLKVRGNIDEIDLQIIQILNDDGRTPFTQIAKELHVSPGMIRQRYHRLVEDGVLQVVAVTNPLLMGYTTMALIGIKVEGSRLNEIVDEVSAFKEVVYMVLLTGSYDLSVEVVCRDNDHLLQFLREKLPSVEGIRDSETFVYLKIVKEIYTWAGKMR